MPVTLEEAKNNAVDDIDVSVIDEFRKESAILDNLTFDDVVNPAGGGATLTYGYRRLVTQPTAGYRTINEEYTPSNVETQRFTVDLAVLGGSFEIDRVLGDIGPSLSGAVTLNMGQKIKAARTFFQDQVINGDSAVDENGFDGLNKALLGSTTEFRPTQVTDWTGITSQDDSAFGALDDLDEFLSLLDGTPTMLLGNTKALAKVRAIARRAGRHTVNPIEGLVGANGRPITRESYGDVYFVDPGDKAGSSDMIIPVVSRDLDNSTFTVQVTGSPTGGTYLLIVGGAASGPTVGIAFNAAAATVKAALETVVGVGNVDVSGTTTKTVTFKGDLARQIVTLDKDATGLDGWHRAGRGDRGERQRCRSRA
jgi:hypothetical protein